MKHFLILLFFTLNIFMVQGQPLNVTSFGAVGDGKTDNTLAIQQAINEAAAKNTTLVFPTGHFLSGMIHLKSNLCIQLEQGAIWQATPDLELFPEIRSGADLSQEGGYTMSRRAFIFADEVSNVTLCGQGLIYPSGDHHEAFPMDEKNGAMRPYGLYFRNSKNITIKDLELKSSAFWMLRAYLCDDVTIQNINLFNHANTNNDGIDIVDCHRVKITGCTVDSSDDAICLKSEAPRGTHDVVISDCIVSSTAGYIKLGTGSFGSFKRIAVSNCVLRPTRAKEIIHVLGHAQGITGLSLMSVDGAAIENISFNNIIMEGMLTPIFVRIGNRHKVTHQEYSKSPISPGTIRNIHYHNITASNVGPIPVNITGYPGHYVEGLSISHAKFEYAVAGSKKDLQTPVAENSNWYPYPGMYQTNLPASGMYLRHVKHVWLDHVNFMPAPDDPRPCMHLEDVINFSSQQTTVNHQLLKPEKDLTISDSEAVNF
ncbi:glycoside hydrolase family 28 protein [Persicobacter psychrovividus]